MFREPESKILKKFLKMVDRGFSIEESLDRLPQYRNALIPYIDLAGRLGKLKSLKPESGFSDEILKKVYINARTNPAPGDRYESRRTLSLSRFRPAFLKPVIIFMGILLFMTFSSAGTIYASAYSVPGEKLYTVKRATETVQVLFTPEPGEGKLYKKFLGRRLDEADKLIEAGLTVDNDVFERLIADIEYAYGKCKQHGCIDNAEGISLDKRMRGIEKAYFDKYHSGLHNQNKFEDNEINDGAGSKSGSETGADQNGKKNQKSPSSNNKNDMHGKSAD